MNKKSIILFCALFCSLFFIYSCGHTKNPKITIEDNFITIRENKQWKIYNEICFSYIDSSIDNSIECYKLTKGDKKIKIQDIIEKLKHSSCFDEKYRYSLIAAKNNNKLPIHAKIGNIDTILGIPIEPLFDYDINGHATISGTCAPVVSKFKGSRYTTQRKKWLFSEKEHLTKDEDENMLGILRQLTSNNQQEFIPKYKIPVINSLDNLKYSVTLDTTFKYYILYASSSNREIEDFLGDIVAHGFKGCSTSLNTPMKCHYSDNSGFKCITLIGINEDWSYISYPLGIVAIDNIAPTKTNRYYNDGTYNGDKGYYIYSDSSIIYLPKNRPTLDGYANVALSWRGTNCAITVDFGGDVKSVNIRGEVYINLDNKESPYKCTRTMYFELGPTIIPITVYDHNGNKFTYKLNYECVPIKENPPKEKSIDKKKDPTVIEINNNINVL